MNSPTLKLSEILVKDRIRVDLGDVEELANSILEVGQLQPIVVERLPEGGEHKAALRCGGRRYAAFTLLSSNKVDLRGVDPETFSSIKVTWFEEMPEYKRIMIELEENFRRKTMTWQENALGIVRYHKAAVRGALRGGEKWSQAQTGALLSMSQANVSLAFTLSEYLLKRDEAIWECETANDAIKLITARGLDELQGEKLRRLQLKQAEIANKAPVLAPPTVAPVTGTTNSEVVAAKPIVSDKVLITNESIVAMYSIGNCLDILPRFKGIVNHIICDPPYGIEMENLTGDAVSRVADTHDVAANLQLLPQFIRAAYDVLPDDGFLCMWYDLDHHEKIHQWATSVGFRVQRWPLIWVKTTPCSNSQAQYNLTKVTEVCYYMRKSENAFLRRKGVPNYHQGPNPRNPNHPFTKPDDLWGRVIEDVSVEGQVILDPFAGEGSCLAACVKRGRVPYGIEIDEKHVASAVSYISEQLNQRSILDDILDAPGLS